MKWVAAGACAAAALCASPFASAAEGGASIYLQGTYNDFAVGMIGPPGVYMRNDTFVYDASIGLRPLGGRIDVGVDQRVWVNSTKLSWVSDVQWFGGTYNAAIAIPVVLNANVSGQAEVGPVDVQRSGSRSGLGDIYMLPLNLAWTWGNQHLNLAPAVILPTGSYDVDRLINLGRNYWAFDAAASYTWLDPKRGHEFSTTAGVLFNGTNPATNYRTGNELHIDLLLGQHFSEQFALGLTGYWYKQLTDDKGTLPLGHDAANFSSSAWGYGLAALYTTKISGKDVNFIAKWIGDGETTNRMKGNLFMLSFALKL